jgi:DNA-binding XRE family transcriptional regulator
MEITKTVANNLRALREGQKLTRDTLAKLAGISSQTIYDIENENKKPSLLVIDSIAKALNVKPFALLSEEESPPVARVPMSIVAKKIMSIPDDVYELAQGVSLNDEAWEIVRMALETAREREERKKKNKSV